MNNYEEQGILIDYLALISASTILSQYSIWVAFPILLGGATPIIIKIWIDEYKQQRE